MKDTCSVCAASFESSHLSLCESCSASVCPECLRLFQNKCQECYFEEKNPQKMMG